VSVDLYIHIFLAIGLIIEALGLGLILAYAIRVEREVAAELKHTIEAYGAGNLRDENRTVD
jgi:hypothetical protein